MKKINKIIDAPAPIATREVAFNVAAFFYTCQNDVLNFVPLCPVLRELLHAVRHRQCFEPWSFAHRATLCWGYLNFSDCGYLGRFSWLFECTYLKIKKKVFTKMNDLILVPYCVLKTTFNCFLHFWSCFKIKSNIKTNTDTSDISTV